VLGDADGVGAETSVLGPVGSHPLRAGPLVLRGVAVSGQSRLGPLHADRVRWERIVCPDLRSTGETHFNEQDGTTDFEITTWEIAALKLGETLAGYRFAICLGDHGRGPATAAGGRAEVNDPRRGEKWIGLPLLVGPLIGTNVGAPSRFAACWRRTTRRPGYG